MYLRPVLGLLLKRSRRLCCSTIYVKWIYHCCLSFGRWTKPSTSFAKCKNPCRLIRPRRIHPTKTISNVITPTSILKGWLTRAKIPLGRIHPGLVSIHPEVMSERRELSCSCIINHINSRFVIFSFFLYAKLCIYFVIFKAYSLSLFAHLFCSF